MPKGWKYARPPESKPVHVPGPKFTCDSIEGHEWFRLLPAKAQEEFRAAIAARERRGEGRIEFARTSLKRSMLQGATLLCVTEILCAIPSWGHAFAAPPVGAALGALWFRLHAGRYGCVVTSIAPFVLLRVIFASDAGGMMLAAHCIFGVLGFVVLATVASMIGQVRERRATDDLDV